MPAHIIDELDYYLLQTENTRLPLRSEILESIPDDVSGIFYVCRNIMEHYQGINAGNISRLRYPEIEMDKVSDILQALIDNGVTDLSKPVPLGKKVIGNCFNIAKLAVSFMRYKGIPARLRYAYCTYFNHKNNPNVNSEQVLAEYWCAEKQRWFRGDPSMNWEILDHLGINVDVDFLDVSKQLSQPISDVWLNCRTQQWNFDDYGVSLDISRRRAGMGHVALKMTHDLACLNHIELYAFDFISPAKRFQQEINLRPHDFDTLASLLHSEHFTQFRFTNKTIPFSTLPRRVLRKSPITGVTLKKGINK
ncbi:transglutaminase-like domain-containing protein [Serratia quinivorans]|uniref:transglutaminase-like domain-containing protein n=1 Tax=Serratia quinivorans TaxID=137545 RepID=UPI0034C6AF8E